MQRSAPGADVDPAPPRAESGGLRTSARSGLGSRVGGTTDNDGRRSQITWPGGASISYGYDNTGRETTITPSTTGLFCYTNSYVKSGADTDLLQTSTEAKSGSTVYSATFGYDALERLTTANGLNGTSYTSTYDADSNLQTEATGASGQSCFTYNPDDETVANYPTFNTTTHACTGTATAENYDNAGEMTGEAGFSEGFSADHAMTSVTPGTSTPTTTYTYADADADAGNSLRTAGAYTSGGVTTSFVYVNGPLGVTARQVTNDRLHRQHLLHARPARQPHRQARRPSRQAVITEETGSSISQMVSQLE